jgi:hypothetical protein
MVMRSPRKLAIDRDNALTLLRKRRHEPLEGGTERRSVQQTEQPAESVVARNAIGQPEKAAQQWLFRLGECRHIHYPLRSRCRRSPNTARSSATRAGHAAWHCRFVDLPDLSSMRQILPTGPPSVGVSGHRVVSMCFKPGKRESKVKQKSKCDSPAATGQVALRDNRI